MKPHLYQHDCLNALGVARKTGRNKALVVMATGLGKTVVSAFEIKRLLEVAPGRVLYLCHNNDILRQARKTYEEVLGDSFSYGYFHGTEKHMHHVDVLFASFQTMATWRNAFMHDEFRYIVVDEVHHAHAATFRPTIEYFKPEWMIGFTATPERSDGLDITKLFVGKPVYQLGLFEALARRYLCDVDYRLMTDEIQNAGVLDTPVGRLSIAELNRTIFIPKRDEEIARIIAEKTAEIKNPRVMIFCASIEHAERTANLMPHATVVHSKLKPSDKNRRLKAFRQGNVDTILTVDMLNEGIDVPEANVVVFLRSTASRTIFLQQLGRGLRKAEGKMRVLVLDFVANCERIEMIDELRQGVRDVPTCTEPSPTHGDREEEERPEPLTLTLDGIEFDERLFRLFEVIGAIGQDYAKEALIAQVKNLAAQLGKTPTALDARESSASGQTATQTTFVRVFGSWNAALIAAGFEPNRAIVAADREQLLEQIRRLSNHVGRIPRITDLDTHREELGLSSSTPFTKEFGSWQLAVEAAGFSESREDKKAVIVGQLRALARKLGKSNLTKHDVDRAARDECPNSTTVLKYFGSWAAAKEAAGFAVLKQRITTEGAIESLKLLAAALDKPLTSHDVDHAAKEGQCPGVSYYCKNFGTLEAACAIAEVPFGRLRDYTKEELTAQLLAKADQLGRIPTVNDVRSDPKMVSYSTFRNVFGCSWKEILEVVGLASKKGG